MKLPIKILTATDMVDAITVSGDGKQIVLDFPNLGEAMKLWKPWADSRRRVEITEMLHQALTGAGLSLVLRVQGKQVACLGGEEKTGLALRLLGQVLGPNIDAGQCGS